MKNINSIYGLFEEDKPLFLSSATTIEDFIKDTEQYFDYCPSGYYPYTLQIIESAAKYDFGLLFIKIVVTFTNESRTWKKEYYIDNISYITNETGVSRQWNNKVNSKLN